MSDWQNWRDQFKPRLILPKEPHAESRRLSRRMRSLCAAPEKSSDTWWKGEMSKFAREAELLENKSGTDMPLGFFLGVLSAVIVYLIYLAI